MRCMTVSQIKGTATRNPANVAPRDGTKVREVWDYFQAHKGEPVYFQSGSNPTIIVRLEDNYGLDIRRLSKKKYVLSGEWFGKVYVDYIAERMEKAG